MNITKRNKNSQGNDLRQKKCKIEINENESESNISWSTKDKKILLEALKKHGSEDIAAISKMLPNISPHNIQSKIFEYSQMAEREDELLNIWLNCGLYQPGDSLIPEALLFIQLFEDHPHPSESGYDFKAMYKFLYESCFEQPPFFDLSLKDRDMLCSLLSKVEQRSWPKYKNRLWEYVGRVYSKRNIKKVYPGKNAYSL